MLCKFQAAQSTFFFHVKFKFQWNFQWKLKPTKATTDCALDGAKEGGGGGREENLEAFGPQVPACCRRFATPQFCHAGCLPLLGRESEGQNRAVRNSQQKTVQNRKVWPATVQCLRFKRQGSFSQQPIESGIDCLSGHKPRDCMFHVSRTGVINGASTTTSVAESILNWAHQKPWPFVVMTRQCLLFKKRLDSDTS